MDRLRRRELRCPVAAHARAPGRRRWLRRARRWRARRHTRAQRVPAMGRRDRLVGCRLARDGRRRRLRIMGARLADGVHEAPEARVAAGCRRRGRDRRGRPGRLPGAHAGIGIRAGAPGRPGPVFGAGHVRVRSLAALVRGAAAGGRPSPGGRRLARLPRRPAAGEGFASVLVRCVCPVHRVARSRDRACSLARPGSAGTGNGAGSDRASARGRNDAGSQSARPSLVRGTACPGGDRTRRGATGARRGLARARRSLRATASAAAPGRLPPRVRASARRRSPVCSRRLRRSRRPGPPRPPGLAGPGLRGRSPGRSRSRSCGLSPGYRGDRGIRGDAARGHGRGAWRGRPPAGTPGVRSSRARIRHLFDSGLCGHRHRALPRRDAVRLTSRPTAPPPTAPAPAPTPAPAVRSLPPTAAAVPRPRPP